ncbi:MAG: hypothetical protein JWO74_4192 [Solirubrobacterales bacterium]|nr:hypothetical protein [Solirubrobacterales bacterium]
MLQRRLVPLFALVALTLAAAPAQAALRAPGLQSPIANGTVEALPSFTWKPVRSAAQYEFQLAADNKFGSIVDGGSFRTQNTAATLQKTIADGDYFWRVRGISAHDNAGRWSTTRKLTKDWTAAPQLQGPNDDFSVSWPIFPLVLRWSSVPHATKYLVSIATDPSLSTPVIGSASSPQETQGTSFAFPASLSAGKYYWAITPVDAQGFKGQRSRTASLTWSWPTATNTRVTDLDDAAEVFDPQFSWDPIPGAARYEVEVNPSVDFAVGSKVCCSDPTTGTSLSPVKLLANNGYFWRVRAIDNNGNAGQWNNGPSFTKTFDVVDGQPSIHNLRVGDNLVGDLGAFPATKNPVVRWDPVPGAARYELQAFDWDGSSCDYLHVAWGASVAAPAWTPLTGNGHIGPSAWPDTNGAGSGPSRGHSYCLQVRAYTDANIVSPATALAPAFTFAPADPTSGPAPDMPADQYLTPQTGTVSTRIPLFTWNARPQAAGYYVVIARDPQFTQVTDVSFTTIPAYAPRQTGDDHKWTDETTSYYWAVIPVDSVGHATVPLPPGGSPQPFEKRSVPPGLISPTAGSDVPTQPTFRWTPAEGALNYQLQVARDADFSDVLENLTTTSTAYTTSSTYPADTVLYWRVRTNDVANTGLTWSTTGTFRRTLPAPTIAPGNPGGGTTIPVLSWNAVSGAVSYDMHVDQADGSTKDFTMSSTSFTPTLFYGTGIWRWKVRANFPGSRSGSVSGGYTAPQNYVRRIDPPSGAKGTKTGSRMLFTWDPDPAAKQYKVDISSSNGFANGVASVTTDNTSWAPDLGRPELKARGTLYWRIATVDQGGNTGAYATGTFTVPRRMRLSTAGSLRKGATGRLTVTLKGASGKPLRKATVRISGAGIKAAKKLTGKRGTASFTVRPRRKGTVVMKASAKGYRTITRTLKVL